MKFTGLDKIEIALGFGLQSSGMTSWDAMGVLDDLAWGCLGFPDPNSHYQADLQKHRQR
jgi:hypothetical protein